MREMKTCLLIIMHTTGMTSPMSISFIFLVCSYNRPPNVPHGSLVSHRSYTPFITHSPNGPFDSNQDTVLLECANQCCACFIRARYKR